MDANKVRMIVVQIAVDAVSVILPFGLKKRPNIAGVRTESVQGFVVISPTAGCDGTMFLAQLADAGYELVDGWWQVRGTFPQNRLTIITLVFATKEFANPSDWFMGYRDRFLASFQKLLSFAFWQVRAFNNPFFQNNKQVPDQRTFCINFNMPRWVRNGNKPAVEWERDAAGNKIGDAPVPLRPKFRLVLDADQMEPALEPVPAPTSVAV